MTSRTLAKHIAKSLYNHKALDIVVLDFRKFAAFTDFFIICSGTSDRHVQAMAKATQHTATLNKQKTLGQEGYNLGHWILLDLDSVVTHIFHTDERELYRLEELWHDVPRIVFKGINEKKS